MGWKTLSLTDEDFQAIEAIKKGVFELEGSVSSSQIVRKSLRVYAKLKGIKLDDRTGDE
jgi:hypothetical protein